MFSNKYKFLELLYDNSQYDEIIEFFEKNRKDIIQRHDIDVMELAALSYFEVNKYSDSLSLINLALSQIKKSSAYNANQFRTLYDLKITVLGKLDDKGESYLTIIEYLALYGDDGIKARYKDELEKHFLHRFYRPTYNILLYLAIVSSVVILVFNIRISTPLAILFGMAFILFVLDYFYPSNIKSCFISIFRALLISRRNQHGAA